MEIDEDELYSSPEISCNFINKEKLLNKYLNITENNFVPNYDDDDENIDYCIQCNTEKILIQSTGIMVCRTCGIQEIILVDSDKPSYKDPPREISYFAYKRINHFNESWDTKTICGVSLSVLFIFLLCNIKYYF